MKWLHRALGSAHGFAVHGRRVRVLTEHFVERLPGGHSVLDVGCGDGLLDSLILERRPDLTIVGLDVLERRQTFIPVATFDGRRIPLADRSQDTVMFCDVLHHTVDPTAMLQEASRVARQRVVVKDHLLAGSLDWVTLRMMDYVGNAPHGVSLPFNYFTEEQWHQAFNASGLKLAEFKTRLALYPKYADLLFGRRLHFIAVLTPTNSSSGTHA